MKNSKKKVMKMKSPVKSSVPAAPNTRPSFRSQFRSTLNPMKEAFDLIRGFIQPEHRDLIQKTPFRHLLNALLNEEVNFDYKRNKPLDDLIMSYSRTEKGFHIGNEHYFPTRKDVQLIFGIDDGPKQVRALSNYSLKNTSLKSRLFYNNGRPDVAGVKILLLACARRSDPESRSDTVKLLCLLLLAGVFFAKMGQTIAWAYFWFVDDLERLCSYDWSSYILKCLEEGLNKPWSNPRHVNGCTLLLWYWLCEHTRVIPSLFPVDEPDDSVRGKRTLVSCGIPRLTKWNLKKLSGVITASRLNAMTDSEFQKEDLEPTANELVHIPSLKAKDSEFDCNLATFLEDSSLDDDSSEDDLELPPELLVEDEIVEEDCGLSESCKATAERLLGKIAVKERVSDVQLDPGIEVSEKCSGEVGSDVESFEESEELSSSADFEQNSLDGDVLSSLEESSDSSEVSSDEAPVARRDSDGMGVLEECMVFDSDNDLGTCDFNDFHLDLTLLLVSMF